LNMIIILDYGNVRYELMLCIERNQHELISDVNDSNRENVNTVALVDSLINSSVQDNTCTTKEACDGGGDQGQSQQSVMWDSRINEFIGANLRILPKVS